MSKKMMKRSLALGALMAFVITGSAMAAEVTDFTDAEKHVGRITVSDSKINGLDNLYINSTGDSGLIISDGSTNVTVTLDKLKINALVNAIELGGTSGGTTTIVANEIDIDTLHTNAGAGPGILIQNYVDQNLIIEGFEKFDINTAVTEGHAISNNGKGKIEINGKENSKVTIVGAENAIYTRIDKGGSVGISAYDISIESKGVGGDDKGHVIYAKGNDSKVVIHAYNDLTLKTVSGKNAVKADSNAKVFLTAGNNITVTGTVQGADGLKSQIDLKGNNVKITAKATTPSETEGAVRNVSIDAKGKVTINAEGLCGVGAGPDKATMAQAMNSIKAKEINITSDNAFGIYANNHSYHAVGTRVHSYLEAETINIESKKDGIYASNGAVTEVKGFKTLNVTSIGEQGIGSEYGHLTFVGGDVVVTSAEEGIRSKLGGELKFDVDSLKVDAGLESIKLTGDSVLNIKAKTVQLDGDITTETAKEKNPILTVAFNGVESYLNGKVTTVNGAQTNLTFNKGATWNVSGESNVSTLISNKGKIVFEDGSHVHIDAGSGDLDITKKDLTAESIKGLSNEEVVEEFDSVAKQLGVKDAANAPKATVVVAEGDVKGEVTGEVTYVAPEAGDNDTYYHGEVTEVTEKVNTKNQAIGDTGIALKLHWRAHMNDMNKRMGELRNAEGEHGVWARMVRGESEYKNTKAQYNQYQLGYDEKLSVDKRWTVGAAVTFAEGDANYGQGSTDDKSTAFAIYGSKLNNDGTFVDLIARYAHLESDLDDVNSGKGDYATNGMSVSAEFGKRIQQGNGLWVEPQVELTYGTIDSAEFKFDSGKAVQVGDMDSLIGRVGFRIGKDLEQGNVYARASYLYDFEGETENVFSNATDSRTIAEDLGGGWWEVGVGANINLSKATYVYADVEKTFGGEVDTNWQWNLGVRYSF